MTRAALAFSGGLDTTVCVSLLEEEYGYEEVLGITVDVGQPDSEFEEAHETAAAHGIELTIIDATEAFAELCLRSVQANATYQGYPLGTAMARPVIAEAIAETAADAGCTALAHGCTGKGNDQLRFEAVWRATDMEVIAPIRDLELTREWEQAYAAEHDLPVSAGDGGIWSIDSNLWSRSIEGGDLEDPTHVPPERIYEWTTAPEDAAAPTELTIGFESGTATTIDGTAYGPVALIERLNETVGAYGVGRTDMMEDRILGLKVRENYEHPGATALLVAHAALEEYVLTKDERDFKRSVDAAWAQKAYEGLLEHPLMAGLEGFIDATQQHVTGEVTLRLAGGSIRPVARDSPHAVYSPDAASFDTAAVGEITQQDAIGVAKYHGFQSRLAADHRDGA